MHSNSVDTGDGKDKEDMEMDEGNEEEDEDEMDSAPLDFTKPGRVHNFISCLQCVQKDELGFG